MATNLTPSSAIVFVAAVVSGQLVVRDVMNPIGVRAQWKGTSDGAVDSAGERGNPRLIS